MVGVNVNRSKLAREMSHALEGAKLIGYNDEGEACVWFGGYGFNVYDAARDWTEVNHFNSGELAGIAAQFKDEKRQHARYVMESRGFEIVG